MVTPTDIAARIAAAAVDRFADANGIARSHLTTEPQSLTPVEVARAARVLGAEVIG